MPAIAVPNDEPRFETLRDSPEISPCFSSGKADWTRLTDGVSITPRPRPISSRPGANAHALDDGVDQGEQQPDPDDGDDEPAGDQRLLRAAAVASRSAASEEARTPSVAAVKITPVLIAL